MHAALKTPLAPLSQADVDAAATSGTTTWREVDSCRLLDAAVKESHGDPVALDLYHDVSAEASHRWFLNQEGSGTVPCMLGAHKVYSTKRGKVLLGLDHLLLLRFPLVCNYTVNSDQELRHLAGLAMHVPQVGSMVALLFAVTTWGGQTALPEQIASAASGYANAPAVVQVKPVGPPMEVRTFHLPGLSPSGDRKRKNGPVDSEGPKKKDRIAVGRDLALDRLPCAFMGEDSQSSGTDRGYAQFCKEATRNLQDQYLNSVDLTPLITDSWVSHLSAIIAEVAPPVVVLGLMDHDSLKHTPYISQDSFRMPELTTELLRVFGEAVSPVWSQWQCTSVVIQKYNQVTGMFKQVHHSKSWRAFEFVFSPDPSAAHRKAAGPSGPVDSQSAMGDVYVWFEEALGGKGCTQLGPIPASAAEGSATGIKMPSGRAPCPSDFMGHAYSSSGRLLACRPNMLKSSGQWKRPASFVSVKWAYSPRVSDLPPSEQQQLAEFGFPLCLPSAASGQAPR